MLDTTHPPTNTMTPALRVALRHADTFCLDFDDSGATIRLTKRAASADPFEDGRTRTIRFPGFGGHIRGGHLDALYEHDGYVAYSSDVSNDYAPESGCWVISCAQYRAELMTAFAAVPIDAELSFTVALDALSNGYCARAGLHGDVLRMTAKKGKTLRTFVLDAAVCAHNTARFGCRP